MSDSGSKGNTDIAPQKNMYILSGLGADERVFQYFDFTGYNVSYIKWVSAGKNQSIENYTKQIISQILHPCPIIMGLSFGGIIAIEIARQIEVEKVILIASVKQRGELPLFYRLAGRMGLHKLIPVSILKSPNLLTNYMFGVSTDEDKLLFRQILLDTDSDFLRWAINRIVKWKNVTLTKSLVHIHGTKDRILPFRYVISDYKIKGGGHLMTLSHPKEIMDIVKKECWIK